MSELISRQVVLDIWHTRYSNIREENEEIQYKKIAFELPSVTPQPKSGEWLSNPLADYAGEGYFICSKCENDVYDATDYCPNCGAWMNGGSEE